MTIPSTRIGDILADKYFLEELLGSGAMGDVYRARNALVGRTVAIKMLKRHHAQDQEMVRRFLREARAANMVRHPNVVDVLDIGQDDAGIPFIVQECLEGEDLARHLAAHGGRMTLPLVFELLIPVVEAVAAAHAKGVVHRDLKPENVYLADVHGVIVPKLLDFGISKFDSGPQDTRLTNASFAIGTPAYMSPEQIRGHIADARVDVWALGVILYEVLAGRLPFEAEAPRDLMIQIATEAPLRIEEVVPDLPASMAAIIHRCLSRDREGRYATAAELASDLRVAAGLPSVPPSRPKAWATPQSERAQAAARAAATLLGDETEMPELPHEVPELIAEAPDLPTDLPDLIVEGAPRSRRKLRAPATPTPTHALELAVAPSVAVRARASLDSSPGFAQSSAAPRARARMSTPLQADGAAAGVLYTAIAVVVLVVVTSAMNGAVLELHFPAVVVASHAVAVAALCVGALAAIATSYRFFARRDGRTRGIVFAFLAALAITGIVQLLRDVDRAATSLSSL
ncbi:MAG: serine/threonine protein kinase [Myxococcaceae bacterium]|nr:serine/threonine protein kinase [Myxococcaceae bacterium]